MLQIKINASKSVHHAHPKERPLKSNVNERKIIGPCYFMTHRGLCHQSVDSCSNTRLTRHVHIKLTQQKNSHQKDHPPAFTGWVLFIHFHRNCLKNRFGSIRTRLKNFCAAATAQNQHEAEGDCVKRRQNHTRPKGFQKVTFRCQ